MLQHVKFGDALQIHDGIILDFYPGLPHMKNLPHSLLVWGSLRLTPIHVHFEVFQVGSLSHIHMVLFGNLIGSTRFKYQKSSTFPANDLKVCGQK